MQNLQIQRELLLNIDQYSMEQVDECLKLIKLETTRETDPLLQEIIDAGLVQIIIDLCFQQKVSQASQFNILWQIICIKRILTNICSGTKLQTKVVIDSRGLDLLLRFCEHSDIEIVVQALWGLGNICGDSYIYRDMIIDLGFVETICKILRKENFLPPGGYDTTIWVLSNLVRDKPKPGYHLISQVSEFFINYLLVSSHSESAQQEAIWGLVYMSDYEECPTDFISLNIGGYLANVKSTTKAILLPTMKTIGNLASQNDSAVDHLIQSGCVPWLINQFQTYTFGRQEVLWALSNIAAGTQEQQKYLLQLPQFVNLISLQLDQDQQFNSKMIEELYFVLGNFAGTLEGCMGVVQLKWHQKLISHKERLFQNNTSTLKMEQIFAEFLCNLVKIDGAFDDSQRSFVLQHLISYQNTYHSNTFNQSSNMINQAIENLSLKIGGFMEMENDVSDQSISHEEINQLQNEQNIQDLIQVQDTFNNMNMDDAELED